MDTIKGTITNICEMGVDVTLENDKQGFILQSDLCMWKNSTHKSRMKKNLDCLLGMELEFTIIRSSDDGKYNDLRPVKDIRKMFGLSKKDLLETVGMPKGTTWKDAYEQYLK